MRDASPHQWQAKADVDRVPAAQQLEGDVSLIVVHGHDAIEFSLPGAHEQGIARPRSADRDARAERCLDGGLDQGDLLVAEQAAIAGMRIQPCYAKPRAAAEETRH